MRPTAEYEETGREKKKVGRLRKKKGNFPEREAPKDGSRGKKGKIKKVLGHISLGRKTVKVKGIKEESVELGRVEVKSS